MSDISMCVGGKCPLKEKCLRYRIFPSSIQTYFSPPLSQNQGKTCEYFLPFNENTQRVRPMSQIEEI